MKYYLPVVLLLLISSIDTYAQCVATVPGSLYACEEDGDGFEVFDLTLQDAIIIGDLPIDDFFVTYHLTESAAEDNSQILPDLYENQNPFVQIIYARLNQISTNCFYVVQFPLKVDEPPLPNTPDDIFLEDFDDDGIEFFDLTLVQPQILSGLMGPFYILTYHLTNADAENSINQINNNLWNYEFNSNEEGDYQEIFVRVEKGPSLCHKVISFKIGLFMDPDLDGLTSQLEDLNENGNYDDDDTDGDDIPNYLDEDDDNDLVETIIERMGNGSGQPMVTGFVDTDGDSIPNYLDDDDDGVHTTDEDYNNNGSPLDDDTNNSNIPDFLEPEIALSINDTVLDAIKLFPSPIKNSVTLQFPETITYLKITVFGIDGKEITSSILENTKRTTIDLEYLNGGIYFISIAYNNRSFVKKIIKE